MTHAYADETGVPRMTRAVRRLMALNVAVYFLQLTLVGASNMQAALGFSWDRLPDASWSVVTVVTYMFSLRRINASALREYESCARLFQYRGQPGRFCR